SLAASLSILFKRTKHSSTTSDASYKPFASCIWPNLPHNPPLLSCFRRWVRPLCRNAKVDPCRKCITCWKDRFGIVGWEKGNVCGKEKRESRDFERNEKGANRWLRYGERILRFRAVWWERQVRVLGKEVL